MKAPLVCVALAVAALCGPSARAEGDPEDLGKTLAAAVDLPTRRQRLSAAATLAARQDVTIEAWLGAMRSFGQFARTAAGARFEHFDLPVMDGVEATTIHVFVPTRYSADKPAPLLMAFHGAGGEGHDEHARWEAAADELGMLVVAPTDASADLGYRCTEIERQRALAALRWARRTFNVDENRVYATGVSRGGHLVWDLALRHPDRFAALVPMIGGPRLQLAEGQNNIRYLENLAHVPIRDLQGAADDALLIKNLKMAFARLENFGAKDVKLLLQPDIGHDFDPHAVNWVEFLGGAQRQSEPLRVVRACTRAEEARSFWVEALRFSPSEEEKFRATISDLELKGMDDEAKRQWAQEEADNRTARIEAKIDGPGKFTVTAKLVQRFRILLSDDMYDPTVPVEVTLNGKLTKCSATRSKLVLLREFVERFDRTFLPVAEVSAP